MKRKTLIRTLTILYTLTLLVGLFISHALAIVPETVTIQGQITTSDGAVLEGSRLWQVSFHDAATTGAQLGAVTTGTVTFTENGDFTLSVPVPDEALNAPAVWYALAIDTDIPADGNVLDDLFTERIRVESVPYALKAQTLEGTLPADQIGAGIVSDEELAMLDGVNANIQTQLDGKASATEVYTKPETDGLLSAKADGADVYTTGVIDALLGEKAAAADVYMRAAVDALLADKADGAAVFTKAETEALLSQKANDADVYTTGIIDTLLADKADGTAVFTKAETEALLSQKANDADVYTTGIIDTLLADKADGTAVFTKAETEALLSQKANDADVYTTGIIDTLLADKATSGDVYTTATIDGLLAQKADQESVYSKTDADARFINATGETIDWTTVTKTGSSLADLESRNAADLTGTVSTDRFSAYEDLVAENKIGTDTAQVAPGIHSHFLHDLSGNKVTLDLQDTVPDNPDNSLYQVNNILYWQGQQVSVSGVPVVSTPNLTTNVTTDLIIQGSLGVGLDSVSGQSFGFDTIRLKENNLRIHFEDTSASGSFPTNDWRIVANDSANGGRSYLGIEDANTGKMPFYVGAGAPSNALVVEMGSGAVGVGTATPEGRFEVTGAMGASVAGPQSDDASTTFTGNEFAQSFMPPEDGYLNSVTLRFDVQAPPTISLYAGSDPTIASTLLGSASASYTGPYPADVTYYFSAPILLTSGSSYLMRGWLYNGGAIIYASSSDGYADGQAWRSSALFGVWGPLSNSDVRFRTTFIPESPSLFAVSDEGNIGIGTHTPEDRLHVTGPVLVEAIETPTSTSNRLYNVGGSLYWNGEALETASLITLEKAKILNVGILPFEWIDNEIADALTVQGGTVDNDSFSAYSDLTAEGLLDNNADSDLLTRSQSDSRYLMEEGDTLGAVTARGAETTASVKIANSTNASDPTVGALVVAGGVGIQKDVVVGGSIVTGSIGAGGKAPTGLIEAQAATGGYTANLCTGGMATAIGGNPGGAFDGNKDTGGWLYAALGQPTWLQYDFGAGNAQIIQKYEIRADAWNSYEYPTAWRFQASNDNSNWTILDTRSGQNLFGNNPGIYSFTNNMPYRYYQLYMTAYPYSFISSVNIVELEMYGPEVGTSFIAATNGNVGIGTDAPDADLDVNGVIRVQDTTNAPSPVTDRLYNNGGDLYWNGARINPSETWDTWLGGSATTTFAWSTPATMSWTWRHDALGSQNYCHLPPRQIRVIQSIHILKQDLEAWMGDLEPGLAIRIRNTATGALVHEVLTGPRYLKILSNGIWTQIAMDPDGANRTIEPTEYLSLESVTISGTDGGAGEMSLSVAVELE